MFDRGHILSMVPFAGLAVALFAGPAAAASPSIGQRPFQPFAGGSNHTCALSSDGQVLCWGLNTSGQIGDGTTTNRAVPTAVAGLPNAVAVAAGGSYSCALLHDGRVKCWGDNSFGQLGNGTFTPTALPAFVTGIGGASMPAIAITAGAMHACAVLSDGTAKCWGRNTEGEIGDGTTTHRNVPVAVPGLSALLAMSAGSSHTCAINLAGEALCWGANANGQLGDGTLTARLSPVPVSNIAHGQPRLAIGISAGRSHTCAHFLSGPSIGGAQALGGVACWGANSRGQVGVPSLNPNFTTPATVASVANVKDIAVNGDHSCALLASGTLRCWGENLEGEAGNGTSGGSGTAALTPSLTGVRALAVGYYHTCAVLSNGTAECWGRNTQGQLGNGTTTTQLLPAAVSGLGAVSNGGRVVTGLMYSCGLLPDGRVKCWGRNDNNQLGNNTLIQEPAAVYADIVGAVDLCAGQFQTCAILASGTLSCWGSDPVTPISGVTDAVSVACGGKNVCTTLANGTIKCWEAGAWSEVQSSAGSTLDHVRVTASGYGQGCAIRANGTLRCWGTNPHGQVGDGTTDPRPTAVLVTLSGGLPARSLGLASQHSCALASDGLPQCWGWNDVGQLGTGDQIDAHSPVPVVGLDSGPRVASLMASPGGEHTCALLADGTASCWGQNWAGMLGDGTSSNLRTSPVAVQGLTSGASVSAGLMHTCATLTDGTARCWGGASYFWGQLGNGTYSSSTVPVVVSNYP